MRPQPDDQRFSDPVWSNELGWNLLKQWRLFSTRRVAFLRPKVCVKG